MGVQHNSAVHLPGKTNATHLAHGSGMAGSESCQATLRGGPPVGRVLFRPKWLGLGHGERFTDDGVHVVVFTEQQKFNFGGPEINS